MALSSEVFRAARGYINQWFFGSTAKPPTPSLSTVVDAQAPTMSTAYSKFTLPDGAQLAFEILGSYHLGKATPLVFINGVSSVRSDYERLTQCLMKTHPVLIYDHRGIGNSTLTSAKDEDITIELMARDLLLLLENLKWKEVVICGFSMGGVVAQQMLLLPYHATNPVPLTFDCTHLLLIGTRSIVHAEAGLKVPPPNANRTLQENLAIAKKVVESLYDPEWVQNNESRFNARVARSINKDINRPSDMIVKQSIALRKFDFRQHLPKLSPRTQVLVIHGQHDRVIPVYCAKETLELIPHARFVVQGSKPGQVPSMNFGHFWFEYFDIQVWQGVVDTFVNH
ncbi:Alpha/Beta hydrolase protein [Panaeolus papilionaceus]|nr:Alpha/Beta hydrolase protein [Panaeolus papilionaceus]